MEQKKWGFWLLSAFVIGNMVGSGIFMLPSTLAQMASPMGAASAWLVTGLGVLMIAFVFGNLSMRKPELTGGPQSYAKAMFKSEKTGKVAGFSMVWGYWVANWISNVAIITSFAGYLSTFLPVMKDPAVLFTIGSQDFEKGRLLTFAVCTILLWGTHTILVNNLNAAGRLNFAATASKVIGFMLFIGAALFAFQGASTGEWYFDVQSAAGEPQGLFKQVQLAAVSTLWAFVGIESAVILSGRARSQADVKKATIFGLFVALTIYMITTLLTMGVIPREELMQSDKPFVDVLSLFIGDGGGIAMAVLALISLFGSTLGWILMSSEVAYQAAKSGIFPAAFGKNNKKGSPVVSLTITNIMSQLFIFSVISGTISEAYTFLTTSATLAYLIPYLVSSIYYLKLVINGETFNEIKGSRLREGTIASLALLYSVYVIISGTSDLKTFFLGIGLFLVGFIVYPLLNRNKKSEGRKLETDTETLK
ncbi:amino acid permease [Metabacillus sp. KIGAM252]|uniref:Amino acid permease n=1 Tax=Metabacillus flavus TaxID=2823519 RepID=A0ABS5LI81_9BACI|nr:amino acid permease [Metabacillus flavus]MBS2970460.1 amino acid permease [Metabacillus flavus]